MACTEMNWALIATEPDRHPKYSPHPVSERHFADNL